MTFSLSNALAFNLVVTLIGLTCFWSCLQSEEISRSTEDYYLNHLTYEGKGVVYRYVSGSIFKTTESAEK